MGHNHGIELGMHNHGILPGAMIQLYDAEGNPTELISLDHLLDEQIAARKERLFEEANEYHANKLREANRATGFLSFDDLEERESQP